MGFFSKLFKKKETIYSINKINEDNLVVMVCPKNKIKLNSKICVPENFCAVFLSKEKLLDEAPSGEHEISGLNFPKVCKKNKLDKPTKRGYKTEFNADFYFVNLKQNVVTNSFFIKKIGCEVWFEVVFKISNAKNFLEFLILEQICFENDYALKELKFYIGQIIYYFVLDNKEICDDKLSNFVKNKLENIGVCLIDLKIKFEDNKPKFAKNQNKNIEKNCKKQDENLEFNNQNFDLNNLNKLDELNNFDENKNNQITEENFSKKSVVSLDDVQTRNLKFFECDNCGAKLSGNSQKCFVCGKSFIEKNVCENCGREISKAEYVCPHCGSVIIQ